MRKSIAFAIIITAFVAVAACQPKVGSDAWCDAMEAKAKGDWTMNEAADFARHCIIRKSSE